jgi:hypothetical protein
MVKIKKSDIGQFMAIRFLDHCITDKTDPDEPIEIEAVGRLYKVQKKFIVLQTWTPITADPKLRHDNSERTVILIADVISAIILKPDGAPSGSEA